jgi:serine/threonine protein kinase
MENQFFLHYRLIKPLGKGSMGSVWMAEDTRLKRTVALKVLSEDLNQEPESLARFRVEAEAAARLNHPGIATVYAVEEADGKCCIAMEYVDGKTLKDVIPSGGLPLPTFFSWFLPLAEALVHAHEKGIIHRDIKPANMMLTRDGVPKLLDFGLARIQHGTSSTDPALTQVGTIMGSPAYMSPEQALGHPLDHRTDLFSFGVVLHEALTGKRPFKGKRFQELIASLTRDEPDSPESFRGDIPVLLSHLIKKCLSKDPNRRYQTARDMLNDMRAASESSAEKEAPSPRSRPAAGHRRCWLVGIGVSVILMLGWALSVFLLSPSIRNRLESPGRIFRIPLQGVEDTASGGGPAISPNGRMITYVRRGSLRVMDLATGRDWSIPDTKTVEQQPFWSPDSQFIGYLSQMGRFIQKVPPKGGGSTLVCDVPGWGFAGDAAWGGEGKIVFDVWGGDWTKALGLMQVSQAGGKLEPLSGFAGQKGETYQAPSFLPDGKGLLFVAVDPDGSSRLMIRSGGKIRTLARCQDERILYPVYSPAGYILYQRGLAGNYSIWAIPFSLSRLEATGETFSVASNGAWPSVSSDGTLVYLEVPPLTQQLVWVDRKGKVLSTIGEEMPETQVGGISISPDGDLIAMDAFENSYENIWVVDPKRGTRNRLTFSNARDAEAAWESDDRISFTSERSGASSIYSKTLDPGAPVKLLVKGEAANSQWSRKRDFLVFDKISPETRRDIFYLPFSSGVTTGDGKPILFLQTAFDEAMPQVSPDGHYLAFMSNKSGRWEVYVRPFPKGTGEYQISVEGGGYPRWSKKGNELFFCTADGLFSAAVKTRPRFTAAVPVKLFDWRHLGLYLVRRYDAAPDGSKFVVVREKAESSNTLVIMENWRGGPRR